MWLYRDKIDYTKSPTVNKYLSFIIDLYIKNIT